MFLLFFNITLNVKEKQKYGLSDGKSEPHILCYWDVNFLFRIFRDNSLKLKRENLNFYFFLANIANKPGIYNSECNQLPGSLSPLP